MAILNEAGVLSYATLSSNFAAREIMKSYLDVIDDGMNYFDWLDFTGKTEVTGNAEYSSLYEGSLHSLGVIHANVAAGATDADVAHVYKGTGAVPLVGETVIYPDMTTALVISVVAASANWTVTCRPASGKLIPAVTALDTIAFIGNAQGEGGGKPGTMRKPTATVRKNNIQIISTYNDITDLAGATKVELEFGGKQYIVDKEKYQQYLKHRMEVAATLGYQNGGYSTTNAAGEKVWVTNGLRPEIAGKGGIAFTTAGAGVFNVITDTSALVVLMSAARCGSKYMLFAGRSLDLAIDSNSVTNSVLAGGAITYADYNGKDSINLAYKLKMITFGGFEITKSRFSLADHPTQLGSMTAPIKEGFLIPTDSTKTKDGKTVSRIRTRYMQFGGSKSLRYMETFDGALSEKPQGHNRVSEMVITSSQGLEITGHEQFGIVKLQ
jgi:hypothetical protein